MTSTDARGLRVSGASARALDHCERALAGFLAWTGEPRVQARHAVEAAPGFVMGHVLEAQLHLCSRDPADLAVARASIARARVLPANARERLHVAAAATTLAGEWDRARALLGVVLERHPRDLLALAAAHANDHYLGDVRALADAVARALPAWSRADPGFAGVLAMQAFGLEEAGDYPRAEAAAFAALELDPSNLRAHHARSHVLEMQGRAAEGLRWMRERARHWADAGPSSTHLWWHLALHHLDLGDARTALDVFDRRMGGGSLNELIDASALLWRLELGGERLGARWARLAERWAPRAEEVFCAFNDVHAMIAFVGAGRRDLQRRLLAAQRRRLARGGTNSSMLSAVGHPASEALRAFGEGRYGRAADLLAALPAVSHRLGGSHAQRGILGLTYRAALLGDRHQFPESAKWVPVPN